MYFVLKNTQGEKTMRVSYPKTFAIAFLVVATIGCKPTDSKTSSLGDGAQAQALTETCRVKTGNLEITVVAESDIDTEKSPTQPAIKTISRDIAACPGNISENITNFVQTNSKLNTMASASTQKSGVTQFGLGGGIVATLLHFDWGKGRSWGYYGTPDGRVFVMPVSPNYHPESILIPGV